MRAYAIIFIADRWDLAPPALPVSLGARRRRQFVDCVGEATAPWCSGSLDWTAGWWRMAYPFCATGAPQTPEC